MDSPATKRISKWWRIPFPKTAPGMGNRCRETEGRWWRPSPPWRTGSSSVGKCSRQTLAAGTRLGGRSRGGPWPCCRRQTAVQLAGAPLAHPFLPQPDTAGGLGWLHGAGLLCSSGPEGRCCKIPSETGFDCEIKLLELLLLQVEARKLQEAS